MRQVRKVVIVGRDVAAWLSANALIRALGGTGLKVEVAELPGLLRPQDTLASLPPLENFHRLLGFDEHALLRATDGAYTLGQSFAGFSGAAAPFFHPYGSHGGAINRVPFMPLWIKARQAGLNVALEEFSLTAAAAKQGRFFTPTAEMSAFGHLDYACHLKAQPYVQFLKAQAINRGAEVRPVRLFDIRREAETGHITGLISADGLEITGDLFIDATGPESLLLGQGLGVGFESWSQWFPGNRVLTVSGERLRSLPAYSQVRALTSGCLHLTPVQDMTGVQHVYNNAYMTDQEALEAAALTAGLRLQPDAVVSPLMTGRRQQAWVGNCIAVGEAAGSFDPMDNVDLHALQTGLVHLIDLFPVTPDSRLEAQEYNDQMQQSFERIRDYQIAHYKLNRIDNIPFWDRLRAMEIPDTLAYKIELFMARGMVPLYEEEVFVADDWLALFAGHGLMPRSYDPMANMTPDEDAIRHFQNILGVIRQTVEKMSTHDAFIEREISGSLAKTV
jgi:tryptophan halogenase